MPTNIKIIGKCSCCGGDVGVPVVFQSTKIPIPTCMVCGAIEKAKKSPVIETEKPRECDGRIFLQE